MNTTSEAKTQTNGKTMIHVKAATKTAQPDDIFLHEIEERTVAVTIEGKSQLICNAFGPKSRQQMEDDRAMTKEEKVAARKTGRKPVTAEEIRTRFQNARLLDSKGRDCIRADWVKGALLTAAKADEIGIASTKLRGMIYVEGDLLPIRFTPRPQSESTEAIQYFGKGPGMRTDIVRVGKFGSKQPDIRYRPCYDDWSVDFKITFEPKRISLALLYHLVRRAGRSVGLCEWRPEGPGGGKGGQFGRFDISQADK